MTTILFLSMTFLMTLGCKDGKKEATTKEAGEARLPALEAQEFQVDTSESVIHWKGKKPTGTHTGTIRLAQGNIRATPGRIESGNFIIDMNSIQVTDLQGKDRNDLEAHLKGTVKGKEGDFFNVRKYPKAVFEITDLTEENGRKFISGNLSIKEETKNITFPVEIRYRNEEIEITSPEFTIDRTQWKVNFGSRSVFEGLGDNFVFDEIPLRLKLIARKE